MRKLPPLAAVRVFEAAARHQNFTAAAAELGMTQAAVSYQIKLLEERVGSPLFARVKRQVLLTDIGRRIAPLITGAFDSLDDAFAVARSDSEAVLTISCSVTFGPNWLAPRIGAFQMTRPELAVRLHTSNAMVDFARDDIDAAIRGGSGDWPGLTAHFLMRMPVAAYASPDYLAGKPPAKTADDVMAMTRISPDDSWWELWRCQAGGQMPIGRGLPGIRLDSQMMEGQAAIAGHGVAVLNPVMWKSEIAAGRLVQPLPTMAFDRSDFWLVYPEQRRNAPKIKAFCEWLVAQVAKEAADDPGAFYRPREG